MASRFSSSDSDMAAPPSNLTAERGCGCGQLARKHHGIAQPAEAQADQIERVVLVKLPRPLRALLGLVRERPLDVARREIDPRLFLERRIVVMRRALRIAVAIHVV